MIDTTNYKLYVIHETAISCKSMHDDALTRSCAPCSSFSLRMPPNTKSHFAINARYSTAGNANAYCLAE